jgi:hypothetical protein
VPLAVQVNFDPILGSPPKLRMRLRRENYETVRSWPAFGEPSGNETSTRTKTCIYQRAGNEPAFDLKTELFRIASVDLTDVPGISTLTAHTILMEVGPDISRFRNASAFASWLGLCPEKRVSGGKILSARSRKVKNRAAISLRLGAHCLYRAKNYLGEFHRKIKWRLGAPAAVTANAHKLARTCCLSRNLTTRAS